jgi:hypothetical protein
LRSKEDNRKEREKLALKVTTTERKIEKANDEDEELWNVNVFERPKQSRRNFIPAGAEEESDFFHFKKL